MQITITYKNGIYQVNGKSESELNEIEKRCLNETKISNKFIKNTSFELTINNYK
jgi:hypothetical protein